MQSIFSTYQKNTPRLLLLLLSLVFFSACSSGGGKAPHNLGPDFSSSGNSKGGSSSSSSTSSSSSSGSAVIEEEELATAMVELALNTLDAEDAPAIDIPTDVEVAESNGSVLNSIPGSASRTTESVREGTCGGYTKTITTVNMNDVLGSLYPYSAISEAIYSDYCTVNNYLTNGTVWWEAEYLSASSYTTSTAVDLTFLYPETKDQYRYKYSQYCSYQGSQETCEEGTWHRSSDGNSYSLYNASVTKSSSNTYSISGSLVINDSRSNTYVYTAKNLGLCENGRIGTGTIELTLNGALYLRVEFTSCSQYSYYVNGYSGIVNY
jgi:hypothetical protein